MEHKLNSGLKRKLIRSHLAIAILGVIALITCFIAIVMLKQTNSKFIQIDIPALEAVINIQSGLHQSLGHLRGWVLVNNQKFKKKRQHSWQNSIDKSLNDLESYIIKSELSSSKEAFDQLRLTLSDLKAIQWRIEDVAQTPGNFPERVYLDKRFIPTSKEFISQLSSIIHQATHGNMPNDKTSKAILHLAKLRHLTKTAISSTIEYVGTNNPIALQNAQINFEATREEINWLVEHKNPTFHKNQLNNLQNTFKTLDSLYRNAITIRQNQYKSLASKWLATEAIPLANKADELLYQLISAIKAHNNKDAADVLMLSTTTLYVILALIALLIALSSTLAVKHANKLLNPIRQLVAATQRVAKGEQNEALIAHSNDELGMLTQSFNNMLKQRNISELKRMQIVETASEPIITINTKGIILSCNRATCDLFGYKKLEMLGSNVAMLMASPHKKNHDSYLKNYLETHTKHVIGQSREVSGRSKSGEIIPLLLSVNEITVEGTHTFAGILRDLRSDKKNQEKIEAINQQLSDENREKTINADLEDCLRNIKDTNQFGEQILAFFAKTFDVQLSMFHLYNHESGNLDLLCGYGFKERRNRPTNTSQDQTLVGQCLRDKTVKQIRCLPPDYFKISTGIGETTPNYVALFPIMFGNSCLGIMELCSVDSKLERSINHIESLCTNIAVYLNNIRYKDQLKGLLHQTEQQNQELAQQEEELRSSNEELEAQAASMKQSEEELRALNEDMNLQIKQINAQKKELEEKSAQLEQISRYKTDFLANMSHELRTPLNSLLILAQGFMENRTGNLSTEQLDEAKIIYDAGCDLLALINDILDLSKVEAGKLTLEIQTCSIEDITSTLKRQFDPIAKNKNISFTINSMNCDATTIETDSMRLQQILKNLISNAIKFTEKGGVNVDIRSEKPSIQFVISDTGIGIPEDKQDEIFSEFKQADNSMTRKFGGTGLGLAISKRLAKRMQGDITLTSAFGKGSSFTLTMPLASCANSFNTHKGSNESSSDKKYDDDRDILSDEKPAILIIDDDIHFAKGLIKIIHHHNLHVLIAENGNTGLQLAKQHLPVGILLDLELPDIPGQQVLDLLKKDSRTMDIPVHIISAGDQDSNVIDSGAISFLQKPLKKNDLEQVLKYLVSPTNKTILVVEDDKVSQQAITHLFSRSEHAVLIDLACTLESAMQFVSKKHYDCIVIDLGLPDATGLEAIKSINDKLTEPVTMIVFTARDLSSAENRLLQQYTDKVIVKGENALDRLNDEVMLFLNHIQPDLPHTIANSQTTVKKDSLTRVLLVDDDFRNTFALSRALENHGFEVHIADNGELAVELCNTDNDIDIILMDMMMPVMDGAESIQRIRSLPNYANCPIIALTARATKQDRQTCINAGATDYMSKPINISELLELMSIWLNNRQVDK